MKKTVLAAAVFASVLVPVTPAYADTGPIRYEGTSSYNTDTTKQAVASCPDGKVVYGTGGQINDGGGDVILTGIVPAGDLRSVTVTGQGRSGHVGPWSVTAYAICAGPSVLRPYRTLRLGLQWSATAGCEEPGTILYGTGFEALINNGGLYLDQLEPDPFLSQVTVHTHGTLLAPTVIAYAICAFPIDDQDRCVGASTTYRVVITRCPDVEGVGRVFGVGGKVEGDSGLHLDALVPGPELREAWVRAARVPIPTRGARLLDDGDATVTAFGDFIGSWY